MSAERKTSLAINIGSRSSDVKLSPWTTAASSPSSAASASADGMASRDKILPTDAVTYDQLADPAAVVSQKTFQSTPTTPQATFIPDQGTNPIARMMSRRRHTLALDVAPMGGEDGSEESWIGVTYSASLDWCDECAAAYRDVVGGEGMDSGARAARTSERGLGKRTAMSGARGRDRRYEKSEPVAVIMVNSARAGTGSSTDPTRMFWDVWSEPGTHERC